MYELRIEVTDADIDMLGHASNVAFVRWIQDVAVAHSAAVGLTMDAYRALGAFFVVRRHEVDYLRPVLRGDALVLRTWIASAAAAKCERRTEIVRGEGGEIGGRAGSTPALSPFESIVARAATTWGFVEATAGRPVRIPDAVRVAFGFPPRASARSGAPEPASTEET